MYPLYRVHVRLRACIQRGVFVMFSQYLKNRLRSRTRMQNVSSHVVREAVRSGSNRASSAPRPKSAPRGSKSTTFAKGIVQLFNLQKIGMNPIGDPSVLPTQFPIYTYDSKLKFEKLSQLEVGVLSVAYHISYPYA